MPWYGNTLQRQQGFGGTPMASTPSGPGGSSGGAGGANGNGTNGVGPYHGPANGGAGSQGNDSNGNGNNGLVWPALHLHPVNDTFAPKQISLSPPGPQNKVKIGRQTNAKTVPHPSNGYFDSKVLSRMHAEVWCQDGKMFIKDVKSSNGTFINGERLSPEAQESDVFELHNEDLVEFGIDIVGDDNKTIIHHKVACRIYLVLTAEDAQAMRNDFGNLYRSAASGHGGHGPISGGGGGAGAGMGAGGGMGPGAEGGLRRGKGTMSFDHILGKLQMELARSREQGQEMNTLNSTIGEIQESLGGGLPPMQEPPFQQVVPPPQPNGADTAAVGSSSSPSSSRDGSGGDSAAIVAALQAQLAETQSSLSGQQDKMRALESLLAEHETVKMEVGTIKMRMEEAQRELNEMAQHKRSLLASAANAGAQSSSNEEEGDDFDDGASVASMDTVTPGEDDYEGRRSNSDDGKEAEDHEDSHVGPRAPPDLPPGLAAATAAAAAAASALKTSGDSTSPTSSKDGMDDSATSKSAPAPPSAPTEDAALAAQNRALSTRLDDLEAQLIEALSFGRALQTQHNLATQTVKALEEKVTSLEEKVAASTSTPAPASAAAAAEPTPAANSAEMQGQIASAVEGALEGRFAQWKSTIEAGWEKDRQDWRAERERLKDVIEAWDMANGKLEEQAVNQVAGGGNKSFDSASTSSTDIAAGGGPAGSSASSTTSSTPGGGGGRRRSSKAAKRRAAKRHLNPALRALLYRDSHQDDFLLEGEGAEDDVALASSGEEDAGGTQRGGDGSSTSSRGAKGMASSLFSSSSDAASSGGKRTPWTSPEGSIAGSSAKDPHQQQQHGIPGISTARQRAGGGGRGGPLDNSTHTITALSAAAVIVGVAAYAVIGGGGRDAAHGAGGWATGG